MPGSRDLTTVEITEKDGAEMLFYPESNIYMISEKNIPVLEDDTDSVSLKTKKASWYSIGKSMGEKTITIDIPEKAAVYVYDSFDNMVYSSYMKDYGNKVYLPENGKIVFLGENGGKINIS